MFATNPLYITPEDYLASEEISPSRHEYRDGEVCAMTGGTRNHHAIGTNLLIELGAHLRGSRCRAFLEGMKTRVAASNSFYYPDLVVTCDSRDRRHLRRHQLLTQLGKTTIAQPDRITLSLKDDLAAKATTVDDGFRG